MVQLLVSQQIIQTSDKKQNSPLVPIVVFAHWELSKLSQQSGESPHSIHIDRLPAGNAGTLMDMNILENLPHYASYMGKHNSIDIWIPNHPNILLGSTPFPLFDIKNHIKLKCLTLCIVCLRFIHSLIHKNDQVINQMLLLPRGF